MGQDKGIQAKDLGLTLDDLQGPRLSRRTALTLAAAAGVNALLAGGARPRMAFAADEPRYGGTLRAGVDLEILKTLDPHVQNEFHGMIMQSHIYNAITTFTPDGEMVPDICVNWELPDERTYVFHLRQGVTFHNGDAFTAEDAKFTFDRVRDPKTGSTVRWRVADVEEVKARDTHTLEIRLRKPYAPFLAYMDNTGGRVACMLNKKAVTDMGFEKYQRNPVGTGPFKVVSWKEGKEIVTKKHDTYWKEGTPYLDAVEWKFMPDANVQALALRKGEIDFMLRCPYEVAKLLRGAKGITVTSSVGFGFDQIGFVMDHPPTNDRRVRMAISYAIDRQEVVKKAFFGFATPAGSVLHPHVLGHRKDYWPEVQKYNPEKAKALLKEAGYDKGVKIRILTPGASDNMYRRTAEVIQAQLRRVGIEMEIENLTFATWFSKGFQSKTKDTHDGLVMRSYLDFDIDDSIYGYYRTGGNWNIFNYSDAEMDKLLEASVRELDPEKRTQVYHQIEAKIMQEVPVAVTSFYHHVVAKRDNVKGHRQLDGKCFFERVWLES